MNPTQYHPGHTVPTSGQYDIISPDGTNTGYQITGVKGKIFPPQYKKPGSRYILSDVTTHRTSLADALTKLLNPPSH